MEFVHNGIVRKIIKKVILEPFHNASLDNLVTMTDVRDSKMADHGRIKVARFIHQVDLNKVLTGQSVSQSIEGFFSAVAHLITPRSKCHISRRNTRDLDSDLHLVDMRMFP